MALHTFWKHVENGDSVLQILRDAKQEIWKRQVQVYQERLGAMAKVNNVSLEQFENLIALTADDQRGEQTRLEIFEGKLKAVSGYGSFNALKEGTAGNIKNLAQATAEIEKMIKALEDAYVTLWKICSNSEAIKSYQELAAINFFNEADGKTLSQIDNIVQKTMSSSNKNSNEVYKKLTKDLMASFGAKDNAVIDANFIKNGADLSNILNQMFNKIQGAIHTLNAVIKGGGTNTEDITQALGNYVGQMIDTSLGFVLEGFETQMIEDKVFDSIVLDKFDQKFAKTIRTGNVTRTGESFGQAKVKTGKGGETTATADVIARYKINSEGKGSVDVLIPISVKGYKLNNQNKVKHGIHVLKSGSSRNIEVLFSSLDSPINKDLVYNIFGSRAGKWRGVRNTAYNANALKTEIQEIKAISAYMLLVDSLSGRAGGIDFNKNAVIFDLNGKFFTISNLLKRLEPNSGSADKLTASIKADKLKRSTALDPGLGLDENSEEIKIERFNRVRQMLMDTKVEISLRNLGL